MGHIVWAWVGLRTGGFLDAEPDPNEVPADLVDEGKGQLPQLREQWDAMYPKNLVNSTESDDG